jgi:methionyl-tRNA formyltransferase
VIQPPRLRDPGWPERLRDLGADVAIVVAFGQILSPAVLAAPARGSINVHASLLPRHRGAAPIQWAIIHGETETGITTFVMEAGMDTGPILLTARLSIGAEETAGELAARLAPLGAEVAVQTLAQLDSLRPIPQRHADATLAPRLKRTDGHLAWERPAVELVNRVRGCNPWPGAVIRTPAGALTLWRARVVSGASAAEPGTLVALDGTLAIATGLDAIVPLEVQPENRRAMAWVEYLRGARLVARARVTSP